MALLSDSGELERELLLVPIKDASVTTGLLLPQESLLMFEWSNYRKIDVFSLDDVPERCAAEGTRRQRILTHH